MKLIPLFSGSSGNSSLVVAGNTKLLIDAGMTGKAIAAALNELGLPPNELSALLVTHDHIDHTKGVGVMSRKYGIPVYANSGTWSAMKPIIGDIPLRNVRYFNTREDFYIGDVNITPFPTPHDAKESVGFTIVHSGRKLLYMTDIGSVREEMFEHAKSTHLAFIEANHDVNMLRHGPYPYPLKQRILSDRGHLSNENCGKLLVRLHSLGVNAAILAHLSSENNTPDMAFSTVVSILEANSIFDMKLCVAARDCITGIFEV